MIPDGEHSVVGNYINASYIGACNMNEEGEVLNQESVADPKFIITQDPLENTIGDFWKMIYEQRSPMIINLTGAVTENEFEVFWPPEVGQKAVYSTCGGRMWVQLVHEAQKPVWLERSIKIWPEGYEHLCMFVRQMQYMGWAINYPPATSNLLKFIDDVANPVVPVATTAGPITVQCRLGKVPSLLAFYKLGGIGRNGFFVTAWILKQNIELGMKAVDIYRIISHLRRYRLGFVNSIIIFQMTLKLS
ncbi:unnamed protein product [Rodentolepis nana]|uniref:Tyrosine-protein phosphatase domain-containing protein n=1 Tax=Rodentolepis nana TaxID=102285 RepID=A0A0R3TCC2_RODNA|nr:unnamed protein product [Rodentolepis nana]